MLKFFLFLIISTAFAYTAHFVFYKYDYWGNYMHIISLGMFAYLPFIAVYDRFQCFFKCLLVFTPVVILIYLPMFVVGVNVLSFWSAVVYMVFLGLAFCRHKYRAGKILKGKTDCF